MSTAIPNNPVIGLRSFGENPEAVADKGLAYARGLEGRASCLSPSISPDMAIPPKIPIIRCLPFIMTGHAWTVWSCCLSNVTSMTAMRVMTGHLYVPALDKARNKPVSMSRAVVTDLLQKELGFRGLCFTELGDEGATTVNR